MRAVVGATGTGGASDLRRLALFSVLLATWLAWMEPAAAADVAIHVSFGTGDNTIITIGDPHVVLDRGGAVDGLPVLHGSGAATIDWRAMRHLVFIPGDPPAAVLTYRDGSQAVFEVEPCHIVSGATTIDIHDVAEIDIR